jgi:ABC-type dipeptide/oligopeptide/nickel transport system permease component
MISAIISVVLGVLSLVAAVPKVLPIIGLALGINALIKENKKYDKKKGIVIASVIGIVSNGFVTVMFLIGAFLK